MDVTSEEICLQAIERLHSQGVKTVVVTSGVAESDSHIKCYASCNKKCEFSSNS